MVLLAILGACYCPVSNGGNTRAGSSYVTAQALLTHLVPLYISMLPLVRLANRWLRALNVA